MSRFIRRKIEGIERKSLSRNTLSLVYNHTKSAYMTLTSFDNTHRSSEHDLLTVKSVVKPFSVTDNLFLESLWKDSTSLSHRNGKRTLGRPTSYRSAPVSIEVIGLPSLSPRRLDEKSRVSSGRVNGQIKREKEGSK